MSGGGMSVRKRFFAFLGSGGSIVEDVRRQRQRRLFGEVLERYGVTDARLTLLQKGFTDVFRVVSPSRGEFALRVYGMPRADEGALRGDPRLRTGAGLRSPETLHSQLLWLAALGRETDLLVPEPVTAQDGSLVVRASYGEASGARHCVLLRWVPGMHKREDLAVADLSRIGSYMARMHDHAGRYPVSDAAAFPRWDWSWPFGGSAEIWRLGPAFYARHEMDVFEAASHRVRRDLEALGKDRSVFGLIHRDLQPRNLIFHNGTVGAIDFDLCGRGHYLLDLTVTLAALRTHHGDRYLSLRDALFEGYRSERPLPKGFARYIGTFLVMRLVSEVNRDLALRDSGTTARQARGESFLLNAVRNLERLLQRA